MYIHEYGESTDPIILALHPMSITGENLYEALSPHLKGNYCIIAPDQGGHGDSGPYLSFENEIGTLKNYLNDKGYHDFALLYGASMGVTAAYELLKDPALHFEKIWFDGGGFSEKAPHGMGPLSALLKPGLSIYRKFPGVMGNSFKKTYGPYFGEIMEQNAMKLKEEDFVRIFQAFSSHEMIYLPEEKQKRMHLEWGENDQNYKNSQKAVDKYFPKAEIVLRMGYGHCNYMAMHTDDYVHELEEFITEREDVHE